MAETVGSMMNNHIGRGRFLMDDNFSKELYLMFNLGPLFLLQPLAKKIFELKKREYIYKRKPGGGLSSHFTNLRDHNEGAAVATLRRKEKERAHLPMKIWERETFL